MLHETGAPEKAQRIESPEEQPDHSTESVGTGPVLALWPWYAGLHRCSSRPGPASAIAFAVESVGHFPEDQEEQ